MRLCCADASLSSRRHEGGSDFAQPMQGARAQHVQGGVSEPSQGHDPAEPSGPPCALREAEAANEQRAGAHPGTSGTAVSRGESPARSRKLARDRGWLGFQPGAVFEGQHKVQTWMGCSTFLLLEPASYSRRILNDQVRTPSCPSQRCSRIPIAHMRSWHSGLNLVADASADESCVHTVAEQFGPR